MKPSGVNGSGNSKGHSAEEATDPKPFCARSASFTKPTLITPIAKAPHQNTSLSRQRENEPQITWERSKNLGIAVAARHVGLDT